MNSHRQQVPMYRRCVRWLKRILVGLAVVLFVVAGVAAWLVLPFYLRLDRVAAAPDKGFRSDYYLYMPRAVTRRVLLVVPNNTGRVSDDEAVHRRRAFTRAYGLHDMADRLGTPMLIPIFPRPASQDRVYTHALDRDTLTTTIPELARLDLQLLAMIDDTRARLGAIDARVLIFGFSANAMFADRFTALHPTRVRAAAVGSPGGWPIAPVVTHAGKTLRYPVGVGDLEALVGAPFDVAAYRAVPVFFFVGKDDRNDAVAYDDGYDPEDRALIHLLFGEDMRDRWPIAEQLHGACAATFKVYPDAGHARTDGMDDDVERFFSEVLAR